MEDADIPLNATIHAGGSFRTAMTPDEDALDLLGLIKMCLQLTNANNTRDGALLVYYPDGSSYNYQARYERGKLVSSDSHGRLFAKEDTM